MAIQPSPTTFVASDSQGHLSVVKQDQDNERIGKSESCSRGEQKIWADLDEQIPWSS